MINAGKTSIGEEINCKTDVEYMKLDDQQAWKIGLIKEFIDALHGEKCVNLENVELEEMLDFLCVFPAEQFLNVIIKLV